MSMREGGCWLAKTSPCGPPAFRRRGSQPAGSATGAPGLVNGSMGNRLAGHNQPPQQIERNKHMTRNGKIARLPKAIREQLNKNLEDGVPGVRLVDWLNSLPAVQQVLTEQFDGRGINETNLSEWKAGGFLDWQARQEMRAQAQELALIHISEPTRLGMISYAVF